MAEFLVATFILLGVSFVFFKIAMYCADNAYTGDPNYSDPDYLIVGVGKAALAISFICLMSAIIAAFLGAILAAASMWGG